MPDMSLDLDYLYHVYQLGKSGRDIVVFDFETTGTDVTICRTVSVAAWRYRDNQLVERLDRYVNPEVDEMPPKAEEVHGLSLAFLRKNGLSPRRVFSELAAFADGSILCGHNIIGYDIPLANYEFPRYGVKAYFDPQQSIDTLLLARMLLDLPKYNLRAVASSTVMRSIVKTDAQFDHDASNDVETSWYLYRGFWSLIANAVRKYVQGTPNQYKSAFHISPQGLWGDDEGDD